jgi:hypothetical protein
LLKLCYVPTTMAASSKAIWAVATNSNNKLRQVVHAINQLVYLFLDVYGNVTQLKENKLASVLGTV